MPLRKHFTFLSHNGCNVTIVTIIIISNKRHFNVDVSSVFMELVSTQYLLSRTESIGIAVIALQQVC